MAKITLRIWILIIVLLLAALSISPWMAYDKGALIKSVEKNSTYFNDGLRAGQTIISINWQEIKNAEDYSQAISKIFPIQNNTKITITTKEKEFIFFTNETPRLSVSNLPKSKIKTGLDLSGGARALVKPEKPLSTGNV